jgi:hypothetical protein
MKKRDERVFECKNMPLQINKDKYTAANSLAKKKVFVASGIRTFLLLLFEAPVSTLSPFATNKHSI